MACILSNRFAALDRIASLRSRHYPASHFAWYFPFFAVVKLYILEYLAVQVQSVNASKDDVRPESPWFVEHAADILHRLDRFDAKKIVFCVELHSTSA